MVMEAIDGLVERFGVAALGETGEETGVLVVEGRRLAGAILGDWRGEWTSSSSRWSSLLMIGGRSGVALCSSPSTRPSARSAVLISRGSGGGFGRAIEAVRDRAGVAGGVGSLQPRCEAKDFLEDGA